MAEFPTEDVERIINEEIVRGHGNTLWTTPEARRRYQKLLAQLVIGERGRRAGLIGLLSSMFDAHYELAPYCTERERIFAFTSDAVPRLTSLLDMVRSIIGRTLSAEFFWPEDSMMSHEHGRTFLLMQHEQIGGECAQASLVGSSGKTVGLHSSRSVTLDGALQVCRYLLLARDEGLEFDEHYSRAQGMLRQASPLFAMPDDVTLQ